MLILLGNPSLRTSAQCRFRLVVGRSSGRPSNGSSDPQRGKRRIEGEILLLMFWRLPLMFSDGLAKSRSAPIRPARIEEELALDFAPRSIAAILHRGGTSLPRIHAERHGSTPDAHAETPLGAGQQGHCNQRRRGDHDPWRFLCVAMSPPYCSPFVFRAQIIS